MRALEITSIIIVGGLLFLVGAMIADVIHQQEHPCIESREVPGAIECETFHQIERCKPLVICARRKP